MTEFRGRRTVLVVLNTLLALPSVVVGLVVYLLLSRAGPLGSLGLLFTPGAMVIEIGEHGVMYTHTLDVGMPDEAYFEVQRQRRDLLAKILPEE